MSYREAEVMCDWCKSAIGDREDLACYDCHEALEAKVAELEATIESLRDELAALATRELMAAQDKGE